MKNQREAILRAEAERNAKMEEMHRQIQAARQAAVSQMQEEKKNRERLERLRQEVDNQQVQRSGPKPQARSAQAAPFRPPPQQQPRQRQGASTARSGAAFYPQDFLDHQVLEIYQSRNAPDDKLPPVAFTKKGVIVFRWM